MTDIENLVFVTKLSSRKLRELVEKLDQAASRRVPAILHAIDKESLLLSSSVSKLAAYCDVLRADEKAEQPETFHEDPNLLVIVQELRNQTALEGPDSELATTGSVFRAHNADADQ